MKAILAGCASPPCSDLDTGSRNECSEKTYYPDVARLVLGATRMPWRRGYGPKAPAIGP